MARDPTELRGFRMTIAADSRETGRKPAELIPIFGYDRITLWLDHSELPIAIDRLKEHCTDIVATAMQMPYQARLKFKLEIFQPTLGCLRLLAGALGHNIAVSLTYVEIACDIPADNRKLAREARNTFLASVRLRYQRRPFEPEKGSWYCGQRPDTTVTVVYADRPSKLNNARPAPGAPLCLHIEQRISGSASLAGIGMVSVDDLIQFDHQKFWNKRIYLYQLPKPTTLGRLLAKVNGADADVSGSALRKRARRWHAQHSKEDKFVMHNALLATPELARSLKKRHFLDWLTATGSTARTD
jgi:hypothetical protein